MGPSKKVIIRLLTSFFYLLLVSESTFGQASLQIYQNFIIKNVRMIDRDGKTEDMIVNIIVKESKLFLITKDKLTIESEEIAFDAKEGILLGTLNIGDQAKFMIVNEDPRENIEVLLDTKSHTVFAVYDGKIAVNKLTQIGGEVSEKEAFKLWRSYAPPPVALPLSYQSNNKWNMIKTKPITAVLAGALLIENTRWLSQDVNNQQQVGEVEGFKGGSIRGLRAGFIGSFNFKKPWTYVLFIATTAFERGFADEDLNEFLLFDYKVDIPLGKVNMSIGKQKEPISLERLTSLLYIPGQQERSSVADGLLPSRNTGVVLNGTFLSNRMSWAGGVFNRWFEVGQSFNETATVFTSRVTGTPYLSADESNLLHIGIAMRSSNTKEGIRYGSKTEIFRGPVSTDTEHFESNSSLTFDFEMAWRKGPLLIIAEYLRSNVIATIRNDPSYGGYYVTASYTLTGEMRPYEHRSGVFKPIPTSKSVIAGGWGTWDVFARWSYIDLTDDIMDGGKMKTLSTGIYWWPISSIQWNINYRYSLLDRYGVIGANHGLVIRLGFILD